VRHETQFKGRGKKGGNFPRSRRNQEKRGEIWDEGGEMGLLREREEKDVTEKKEIQRFC